MVLETSQERVKLLKAGQIGTQIENAYIQLNDFVIVGGNILQTLEARL
jgi:hypothetical protein